MNIPEEEVGSATKFINENTTPEGGDRGALDNLNKAIEENPDVKIL